MAQVTLNKSGPRSIVKLGIVFHRNVPETLDARTASRIKDDPRFDVDLTADEIVSGATEAVADDEEAAPQGVPTGRDERLVAIRDAIGDLSLDDEEAYTLEGKPDARYLSKVLGWQVTAEERDAALAQHQPRSGRVKLTRLIDSGEDASMHGAMEV